MLILSIPSVFLFADFRSIFGAIFDLRDSLDRFPNFLLDLVITKLWLKSCSNPLQFQEVFWNPSFGVLVAFLFSSCFGSCASLSEQGGRKRVSQGGESSARRSPRRAPGATHVSRRQRDEAGSSRKVNGMSSPPACGTLECVGPDGQL